MATLSRRDVEHVFDRLRSGVVPERGLEPIAVGIERQRGEVHRMLDLAKSGEGVFKFLRGGYGCGKTFLARLAVLDAQERDFATSFVVVSDNDLHFHRFDDVYRKVMQELGTSSCPRGALADIVSLEGEDFERDYLAAKVKGHTELIEMIDTKLLGDARSDDVRQHVQATRDHLAAHLEQAKALRPAMNW